MFRKLLLALILIFPLLSPRRSLAPMAPPPLQIKYAFFGPHTAYQEENVHEIIKDGWTAFDHLTGERIGPAFPVLTKDLTRTHIIVTMVPLPNFGIRPGCPAATVYKNRVDGADFIVIVYYYFQYLKPQDQMRTIIHEMGHFCFSLSDEYPPFHEPAIDCPMGYCYNEWTGRFCKACEMTIRRNWAKYKQQGP